MAQPVEVVVQSGHELEWDRVRGEGRGKWSMRGERGRWVGVRGEGGMERSEQGVGVGEESMVRGEGDVEMGVVRGEGGEWEVVRVERGAWG